MCSILTLTSTIAYSQVFDPLGTKQQDIKAKVLVVTTEQIEIDTNALTDLLFGDNLNKPGEVLRKEVEALIKTNKAKLVGSTTSSSLPGEKVQKKSTKPTFFPTEYDAAKVNNGLVTPIAPKAIEERPVGTIFEAEPRIMDIEGPPYYISLSLSHNVIKKHNDLIWFTMKVGDTNHKVTMPVYSERPQKHKIVLQSGKTELSSVIPARNADGTPNPNRKILTFVKCSHTIVK